MRLPCGELLACGLSLAVVHGRGSLQRLTELLEAERVRLSGHLDSEAHLVDDYELSVVSGKKCPGIEGFWGVGCGREIGGEMST